MTKVGLGLWRWKKTKEVPFSYSLRLDLEWFRWVGAKAHINSVEKSTFCVAEQAIEDGDRQTILLHINIIFIHYHILWKLFLPPTTILSSLSLPSLRYNSQRAAAGRWNRWGAGMDVKVSSLFSLFSVPLRREAKLTSFLKNKYLRLAGECKSLYV